MRAMRHALPCTPLRRYIDRYWTWQTQGNDEVAFAPVLPGTGAELLIHLGRPLRRADGGDLPDAHLLCVRRRALDLAGISCATFFAVRFRAGALRHFTSLPIAELADANASAVDLWSAAGRELATHIRDAARFEDRTAIVDRFLVAALDRCARIDRRPDVVARALYVARGGLRIDSLARDLQMTRRQLERSFKAALGVSPKAFACVARFQVTVRAVVTAGSVDYLPAALDAGYFDQAHFVHEFRRLTGRSPRAYLAAARDGSHFYRPSLASHRAPSMAESQGVEP